MTGNFKQYGFILLCLPLLFPIPEIQADSRPFFIVASTTSTENSGLFEFILPRYEAKSGIDVRVVAVGTGAALRLARRGDADLLLVHHKESEEDFVANGYGIERFDLMYNDFVLVGPAGNPAGIEKKDPLKDILGKIFETGSIFLSRGDDSGTEKKEKSLWPAAGLFMPDSQKHRWYRESGSGMGATLNIAASLAAYTLSDRATWIRFSNKQTLEIIYEGDPVLFNQYGITLVNPHRHPHIKKDLARDFMNWLLSSEGQRLIAQFQIDGQQLFYPNALPGL